MLQGYGLSLCFDKKSDETQSLCDEKALETTLKIGIYLFNQREVLDFPGLFEVFPLHLVCRLVSEPS